MTGQHDISMKTRGEIRCSGRVSISCSAYGTRHDVPYVISNETYLLSKMYTLPCGMPPHYDILKIKLRLIIITNYLLCNFTVINRYVCPHR